MKTNFAALGLEQLAADKKIEAARALMEAALAHGNMGEAAAHRQTLTTLHEARIDMTWDVYARLRKEML